MTARCGSKNLLGWDRNQPNSSSKITNFALAVVHHNALAIAINKHYVFGVVTRSIKLCSVSEAEWAT